MKRLATALIVVGGLHGAAGAEVRRQPLVGATGRPAVGNIGQTGRPALAVAASMRSPVSVPSRVAPPPQQLSASAHGPLLNGERRPAIGNVKLRCECPEARRRVHESRLAAWEAERAKARP